MSDAAHPVPIILMVDDNEEDVELLSLQLKAGGLDFELIVCENTRRAAQFIEACKPGAALPQLVVLDLHLPPQNGEAIFQKIRDNPALVETPVLIMTTSASPAELNAFQSQPHTKVATKPYALNEYDAIVQTVTTLLDPPAPHA